MAEPVEPTEEATQILQQMLMSGVCATDKEKRVWFLLGKRSLPLP